MQIKYRFRKGSLLKTNCPYRTSFIVEGTEYKVVPKVGSGICKVCEFFGGVDVDTQTVECKHD